MSDNIQKSLKRWLNSPENTYPNIDKAMSRLTRTVRGDFIIKNFNEDTSVSELTFWVSRSRGDDASATGAYEKPYASIQAALDAAVAAGGHQSQKTILVEAKTRSRRDVYAPFFCNTRNVTIKGVGGIPQISANSSALGDDPGTLDSINGCVFTNMTAAGFADFVSNGGFDYTYSSNVFTWTGADFFGYELDNTLQTSGTSTVSWSSYYPNIHLENLYFRKMTTAAGFGAKTPMLSFLFGGANSGDTVSVRNVNLFNVKVDSIGSFPTVFANNLTGCAADEMCSEGSYGEGAVELNCDKVLFGYSDQAAHTPTSPKKIIGDSVSGTGGVKNFLGVIGPIHSTNGIHIQSSSSASLIGDIQCIGNNASNIDLYIGGNISLKYGVRINTQGNLTINNASADQSVIECLTVNGNFVNTAGSVNAMQGTVGGNVTVTAGTLKASNLVIRGNLVIENGATIDFTGVTVLGTVTLGATSVVTRWKGGAYFGTLTDSGTHGFPAAATLINK